MKQLKFFYTGAIVILILPIIFFYVTLLSNCVNIPYDDDFPSLLLFITTFAKTHGIFNKITLLITQQYSSYKLIFENAIASLYYFIFGKINFIFLQIMGDLFVLLILYFFILIIKKWVDNRIKLIISLIPVVYILFQFQYFETLNWAMAGLQNIPVIAFSFFAIYFLLKHSYRFFLISNLFFVLAVFSSGNGLLLFPIGILIILQQKNTNKLIIWLVISIGLILLYFFDYHFKNDGLPMKSLLYNINLPFALSFMGAAFTNYSYGYKVSFFAGVLILSTFLFMFRKRSDHTDPEIFYSFLFIIFTAVAVSSIRGKYGLAASLWSRYAIYSDLAIIFCYLFLVKEIIKTKYFKLFIIIAIILSIFFNFNANKEYYSQVQEKKTSLIYSIEAFRNRYIGRYVLPIPYRDQTWALNLIERAKKMNIYFLPNTNIKLDIPLLVYKWAKKTPYNKKALQNLILFYIQGYSFIIFFPPKSKNFFKHFLYYIVKNNNLINNKPFFQQLYPYRQQYCSLYKKLNKNIYENKYC